MFIGGRVIAGLGGSGLINGALTMVSGAVAKEKRACTSLKEDMLPLKSGRTNRSL